MINSLSIIIPFYNEEKRISTCLTELDKFHKKNKKKIEVIFVDDGSHDNSKYIIMKHYKKKKSKKFFFSIKFWSLSKSFKDTYNGGRNA